MSGTENPDTMVVSELEMAESLAGSRAREGALQWFGSKVSSPISLVLPMFNESSVVDVTLRQAIESLERDFVEFEIVVADDASTDDSAERVSRWVQRDQRIRLVRLPRNQRFGGALRAGLSAGAKEFLVYMDFDLPVALHSLPQLLQALADADVLTGYSADEVKHVDWKHVVVSRGYNQMVRSLFGLQLRDINFGFKALRKRVWQRMSLRSCSPFVDAELFVRAERLGFRIKQIPVPFSQRQMGTSHIRRTDVIATTMFDMARLRLALWRRRP